MVLDQTVEIALGLTGLIATTGDAIRGRVWRDWYIARRDAR
jgi:hypothetical protein